MLELLKKIADETDTANVFMGGWLALRRYRTRVCSPKLDHR
jgi:hypothetical protein